MFQIRSRRMRMGIGMLLCFLLFFISQTNSHVRADSPLVTGTITAGLLSETSTPAATFTATLGSSATYLLPITVSDLTGNTNGWNLTIASTPFTTLDTLHTLPTSASTITAVTATCVTVNGCTSASLTNGVSTLPDVPAGASATPVKFFSISSGGLGVYTVTPTISVTVPATAVIGVYTSVISIAVASGP